MPIVMRYQDSQGRAWLLDHGALSLSEARKRPLGVKAASGPRCCWEFENAFSSRATFPALTPQRPQASESLKNQAEAGSRGSQLVVLVYLTGPVNQYQFGVSISLSRRQHTIVLSKIHANSPPSLQAPAPNHSVCTSPQATNPDAEVPEALVGVQLQKLR